MKYFGLIKNFSRKIKYRRDKKDEEDSINLLDLSSSSSPSDNNNDDNAKIIHKLIRRIPFFYILRYVILIPLIIYLLIILTPIKSIQAFIPMDIENSKNFLIVVAHPDDECLFFSPTILNLISRGKSGHILVLSTGNSLGLGPIREKEIQGSCHRLGIPSSQCLCLNLTDLQDNPKRWWPKTNISDIIDKYIKQNHIDLLITFDRGGISGHVNHRSIAIGIEYYIANVDKTPLIYEISTVSTIFEFSSILDIVRTIIKFLPRLFRSLFSTILPFLFSPPDNQNALFVLSPFGYYKGLKAFHAHYSQVLWFRHLYTTFSRHMFMNDLIKVSVN